MINHDPQSGYAFGEEGYMLKMAGENSDIVKGPVMLRHNAQSINHVIADDPIRIGFDIYEMTYTN
jgi:hypothetical protein